MLFTRISLFKRLSEATKCEIIFVKHITDKKLMSKIYMKIVYKSRQTDNLMEKWTRDLKRYLTKE